jgi:hypothetical protein
VVAVVAVVAVPLLHRRHLWEILPSGLQSGVELPVAGAVSIWRSEWMPEQSGTAFNMPGTAQDGRGNIP